VSDLVRAALATIVEGGSLSIEEARAAMGSVMDGEATPAQLAALLVALRMRGETVEELVGFAGAMRERATPVDAPEGTVDTCGTGGDASGTFNISTAAALVVAAAGVPVAKHGNRAITSQSGSADVLDALGVRIDHDAESAAVALRDPGFAFLFAPNFHPAMKHAGPTRREIGVRTAFNLLGPLSNPAGARRQVIGVADPAAAARIAEALHMLGTERSLVVHGDGLDELPLDGSGVFYLVTPAGVQRHAIEDTWTLTIRPFPTSALAGGSPGDNAAIIERLLQGPVQFEAAREVVVLNAAAGLFAAGVVDALFDGVGLARTLIDGGRVGDLLMRLRDERRTAEEAREAIEPIPRAQAIPAADAARVTTP
jgi:anthranilate phosphoribosyltransferase